MELPLTMLRLLFPVFLFLTGCSSTPPAAPILLGHLKGQQGEDEINGLALAVEAINTDSAKQITGRKLRVIHSDAGTSPEEAQGQAVRLLTVDKVDGLLGPSNWPQVEKASQASQSPGHVVVSFNGYTGSPPLGGLIPVGASPIQRGHVLARHAKESLKAKQIVVLKEFDAVVPSLVAKAFVEEFGSVVEQTLRATEAPGSFTSKPDAVILCGSARAALAWRGKLPDVPMLFGGEEANVTVLQRELEPSRPMIAAVSFHPNDVTAASREFVRLYRAKHGKEPSLAAALAYDSVNVWSEAARRANSLQAEKMREQFSQKGAEFNVLTGKLTFDIHGPKRPLFLVDVEGAKLRLIQRLE